MNKPHSHDNPGDLADATRILVARTLSGLHTAARAGESGACRARRNPDDFSTPTYHFTFGRPYVAVKVALSSKLALIM